MLIRPAAISDVPSRFTWAAPLGDRLITSTCPSPIRCATARAAAPGAPPSSSARMPRRSGRASPTSARRGDSDDVMSLVKHAWPGQALELAVPDIRLAPENHLEEDGFDP